MKRIATLLQKITATKHRKTIAENFFSLSLLQIANYIFPLITLPYLVRIIGVSKYGLIAFASALIQFFVIFTDYGFNLSATRDISINRSNRAVVSDIFNSVTFIKMCLTGISFAMLVVLVLCVNKFRADSLVYLLSFGVVFGNALFPVWLFQGLQEMKYTAALNLLSKAVFTGLIFLFVKDDQDYLLVPIFNSLGFVVAGIVSLWAAFFKFKIAFAFPSTHELKKQFRHGWHVFFSRIATNLYTTSNVFFLGVFSDVATVGYFSAADRIIRTVVALFNPIFQALYPHVSSVAAESKDRALKLLFRISRFTAVLGAIFVLIIFMSAPLLSNVILGKEFTMSAALIKAMSPLLCIVPLSYIFANLTLLPFRQDRALLRIYAAGACINAVAVIVFVGLFNLGAYGAACASVLTELSLVIFMVLFLRAKNLLRPIAEASS